MQSPASHLRRSGWPSPHYWPAAGCHSLCTWLPTQACPQAACMPFIHQESFQCAVQMPQVPMSFP